MVTPTSLSAELATECSLLWRRLLGSDAGVSPLVLPAGDWHRWLAVSPALGEDARRTYLHCKAFLAAVMLTTLLGFCVQYSIFHPFRYWFLYLTNVTLCIQCTSLSLGTYACWRHRNADGALVLPPPPAYLKHLIALQSVTLPAAALVTALFWLLVYPSWPVSATFVVNYFVHGVNLVVALLDTWLSCAPAPLAYAALLWPYGCAYLIFTLVYFVAGGLNEWGQPWIYIPIYWGAPDAWKGGLLAAAVLLFVVPLLSCAAWAFSRVRDRRRERLAVEELELAASKRREEDGAVVVSVEGNDTEHLLAPAEGTSTVVMGWPATNRHL